jgi:acetyl-CoA carboxylase biotin carboxyl carrier protein
VLEHEDVEEILKLLDATPVEEFELETGRFRIILRRTADGGWTQERETRPDAGRPDAGRSVEPTAATPAATGAFKVGAAGADVPGIRSPLVGTYYRAPKPGAPPFVEVGSVVGPDAVVGIVETMKLMTAIYAGQSGRIDAIVVADGELVEQNQILMTIVPAQT